MAGKSTILKVYGFLLICSRTKIPLPKDVKNMGHRIMLHAYSLKVRQLLHLKELFIRYSLVAVSKPDSY